jgi:hypothetical protein
VHYHYLLNFLKQTLPRNHHGLQIIFYNFNSKFHYSTSLPYQGQKLRFMYSICQRNIPFESYPILQLFSHHVHHQ